MLLGLILNLILSLEIHTEAFVLNHFGRLSGGQRNKQQPDGTIESTIIDEVPVLTPSKQVQPLVPAPSYLDDNVSEVVNLDGTSNEVANIRKTTMPISTETTFIVENNQKCNHSGLRDIMKKSVTDDRMTSKRRIAEAARNLFKFPVDVICSSGHLSYAIWTGHFCEIRQGSIICLAYSH